MLKVKIVKVVKGKTRPRKKDNKTFDLETYTAEDTNGNVISFEKVVFPDDLQVNAGDEILVELEETQYGLKCKDIQPALPLHDLEEARVSKAPKEAPTQQSAPQPPPKPSNGVPDSVWQLKDIRMARMNSYAHAVEIVRT